MTAAAWIDFKKREVPNILNYAAMVGLPLLFLLSEGWFIVYRLLWGTFLFSLMFLMAYISYRWKGDAGIGGGDLKLIFWYGVFMIDLSAVSLPLTMLLMAVYILSQMLGKRWTKGTKLPFVPFLWAGTIVTFLFN